MQRVTGMDARHWPMDDDKETRFAQWKRGLVPGSHVLTKAVGGTISASWLVTNTGGVRAFGGIEIFFPAFATGFFGPTTDFPPGSAQTLNVSGVITTLPVGTHAAQVRIVALAPATVAPGGTHDFTLTVSPAGGAILTASPGGPNIS